MKPKSIKPEPGWIFSLTQVIRATNPFLITLIWVTVRESQKEILILKLQTFLWPSIKSKSCLKFWTADEVATDLCYLTLYWALWCSVILASSRKWHHTKAANCWSESVWWQYLIQLTHIIQFHILAFFFFFIFLPIMIGEWNKGPLSPPSNLGDKKRNVCAIWAKETFKVHIEYQRIRWDIKL